MNNDQPTYVKIRPDHIEYAFHIFYKEEGKFTIGYIPAYDIVFTANNRQEAFERAKNKADAFMGSFNTPLDLFHALEKLGFKSHEPATNELQLRNGKGSRGKLINLNAKPDEEFEFNSSEFIVKNAA